MSLKAVIALSRLAGHRAGKVRWRTVRAGVRPGRPAIVYRCFAAAVPARSVRALSSSLAIVSRWTSSGPSPKRRARMPGVDLGQREVLGQPGGAVDLDRPVEHPLARVGGGDLELRELGARGASADPVDHPRGVQREQTQLLDLDARLGDLVAHHAHVRQTLSERRARERPVGHELQRAFAHADGAHAVVDAPGPEACLGDLEAATLAEEHVRRPGRARPRTPTSACPEGASSKPSTRMLRTTSTPGARAGTRISECRAVAWRAGVGEPEEEEDLAARIRRAGDVPLAPVDEVAVTVARDRRSDVGGVRRGRVRARSSRTPSGSRLRAADAASAPSARRCRTGRAPPCCRCRGSCS